MQSRIINTDRARPLGLQSIEANAKRRQPATLTGNSWLKGPMRRI
jgi:hypothetical protein